MNAETIEALHSSIKHWQTNAREEYPGAMRTDAKDCALCDMFLVDECEGCPVFIFTGEHICKGTPYRAVLRAITTYDGKRLLDGPDSPSAKIAAQKCRDAAQREVDFLIKLLPEEEQQRYKPKEDK